MAIKNDEILNSVRIWIFPVLVTVLGSLIWMEIVEIKSDVKQLLAQSNIDKTKIENLQQDIKQLESIVFSKRHISATVELPFFLKWFFKPEERYDVKKYLRTVNTT